MSQFYDLASLVVIPSGYKASTIYAQKPLTTDGQLSFTRASTATRVNASGLIEAVASNVPRLDYLGSSCPRLLLEPQRTNLITFSEQLNNAAWTKYNCSISSNAISSPDGTINADYILEDSTASTQHRISISVTSASAVHTLSVFVKQGSGTRNAYIDMGPTYCYYNFSTGAISVVGGTASAVSYGNGWYRLILTSTSAINPVTCYLGLANGNSETYTGNGTSSISFYGAQLEAGAYATSYIPSLGSATTRVADAASKTGISSLIGQTEGTLYAEFNKTHSADESVLMIIAKASDFLAYRIQMVTINNAVYLYAIDNNVLLAQSSNITIPNGTNKIAVSYGANGYKFYVNGAQQFSNATTTAPACDAFRIGSFDGGIAPMSDSVATAILFKTQLTNAQLAELTTL